MSQRDPGTSYPEENPAPDGKRNQIQIPDKDPEHKSEDERGKEGRPSRG